MTPVIDIEEDMPPSIVDAATNAKNMEMVKEHWSLGPEKADDEPNSNPEYWNKLSVIWNITPLEARRQKCANCEYFENTPLMMEAMEDIPRTAFDKDGGGRGYCHKFDFICHNLRTCQAWELKEYERD